MGVTTPPGVVAAVTSGASYNGTGTGTYASTTLEPGSSGFDDDVAEGAGSKISDSSRSAWRFLRSFFSWSAWSLS